MNLVDARALLGAKRGRDLADAVGCFEQAARATAGSIVDSPDSTAPLQDWAVLVGALNKVARSRASAANKRPAAPTGRPASSASNPRRRKPRAVRVLVDWRESPSEERTREALTAWAIKQRRVAHDAFLGPLSIADETFCRYTVVRVIETSKVRRRSVAGTALPARHRPGTLDPASSLRAGQWDFVPKDSIKTGTCEKCVGGRAQCGTCSGSGLMRCETNEKCRACGGSGDVRINPSDPGSRRVLCPGCHGVRIAICATCNGQGQARCTSCSATGWVRCYRCKGSAVATTYTHNVVKRQVDSQSSPRLALRSPLAAAKNAVWRRVTFTGGQTPIGLPAVKQRELDAMLTKVKGEVYREVTLEILPAVAVDYTLEGVSERVYLVGEDLQVVVPPTGIKRLRFSRS